MVNFRNLGKAGFVAGFTMLAIAGGCLGGPTGEGGDETIKIGFMAPLTGDAASIGAPMQNAAKLIVEKWNAAGGIAGKKIEITYQDDGCTEVGGGKAAQQLINVDKVKVLLGGVCSTATLPATKFAEENKVLEIALGASSPKISDAGDYVFRTYPSDTGKGKLLGQVAAAQGFKTVGVLAEQSDYAIPLKDVFVASFEGSGGKAVVETYTADATDLRTQLTKLKEAKVDALFLDPQTPNKGLLMFQHLQEMKWKVPLMTQDVIANDKDTLTKEKDMVEGMIAADVTVRDTDPAVLALRAEYKAKYGMEPNFELFIDAVYDAFDLVKKSIETVGYDTAKMKDYLYGLKDYKGLMGSYTFDKNGDPMIDFTPLVVKAGILTPAPELLQKKEEAKVEDKAKAKTDEKAEAKEDSK